MSQSWRGEGWPAAGLDPKEPSSHREADGRETKGRGIRGVTQSCPYSRKTSSCLQGRRAVGEQEQPQGAQSSPETGGLSQGGGRVEKSQRTAEMSGR